MFSFDEMITPSILKFLYVIGLVCIALFGLVSLFTAPGFTKVLTIPFALIGMVLWRVYMELLLLSFSIHDRLVSIDEKTEKSGV